MFTDEEFLKALSEFPVIVEEPREYRLHYDDVTGGIYMCTMQNHPKDTKYLVVDEKTYLEYYKYQVIKGKLKIIDNDPGYRVQLTRSDQGYAVVKNHAGILLEDEIYDSIEHYATKIN
jgi:hypothetical protein